LPKVGPCGAIQAGRSVARDHPPASVYAEGTKPYDGASAYAAFGGGGVARWGDYSAAVASGDTIWVAAEWVPGDFGFPPYQANWGTAIGAV
jgi:hypothetical protein